MKIKLIYTPKYAKEMKREDALENASLPPLGIASVISVLRNNGYKCDQDDLNIKVAFDNVYKIKNREVNLSIFEDKQKVEKFLKTKNDPELEEEAEKILKKTKYKKFDLIGFSILEEVNLSSISIPLVLSKLIKEKTGTDIVVGGINYPRPVNELNEFLKTGLIDYIIMGDGETALLNLCHVLDNNSLGKFSVINVFSKKMDHKKPAFKKFMWGDFEFPRPDFDGLPLKLYMFKPKGDVPKSKIKVLALPYVFIKGCIYNCIFCPASKTKEYRSNDTTNVVEDLKYLSRKYKTKYFFFINSTINPSYEYAERFVNEIKKENVDIVWADCANFNGMDLKLLKGLKESGAVRLLFGIESASEKMQRYVLKNINIKNASLLLKESHKIGIWNELELIAGMPYETDDDINNTIKFVKKNKPYLNYCYLNAFRLVDSLLLQKPEVFGITNIRDNMASLSNVKWFSRAFDETKGLKWVEKEKQILKSYDIIKKEIDLYVNNRYAYFPGGDIRLLFYLHSVYDNKEDIIDYFKKRGQITRLTFFEAIKHGISKIGKNWT